MSSAQNHVRERIGLLRFLTRYFEQTSVRARDPESHARLLAEFRIQLADLETHQPQFFWRFSTVQRLVSAVFGKARTI